MLLTIPGQNRYTRHQLRADVLVDVGGANPHFTRKGQLLLDWLKLCPPPTASVSGLLKGQ
eukprot:12936469-Prorocentrum_lima.AAC.1